MTTDRELIAEGRQLLAATTNGPWQVTDLRNAEDGNRDCLWVDSWSGPEVEGTPHEYRTVAEMTEDEGLQILWTLADAQLIVWARNHLPALLDAAEKLERVRAALADHPRCDIHPDDDPVSCGWKRAVADVQRVIDDTEEARDV